MYIYIYLYKHTLMQIHRQIFLAHLNSYIFTKIYQNAQKGGARVVMAIIVGSEHGEPRSNPGRGCLHFRVGSLTLV